MDRYVVIVKPLKFAHLSTKFKSSMMIVIAWAIGLSLGLFPLFFNIAWFEFIEAQRACVLITKKSLLFTTLYLLLSFGIPLLIVVFCYSAIFKVAWTKRNKINICLENVGYCKSPYGGLLAPSKSLWCCSLTGFSLKLNRRSGTLQRKISTNNFWNLQARSPIKSIFTLVSIVGFFLIISLPDAVRTLECLISGSSSQIGHTISYWASNLGYFSHPFLYGLLNRSIRKELYKIFNIHQTGSTGLRVRKRHVTTLPKIPERRISMPVFSLSYNQSNEKIGVPPYLVHWRKNKVEMTNSSDPSSNNRRTSEPINFESYQRLRKRRLTTEYLLKEKERRTLEKNPMIIITPPIQ
nr:G-protein coupled receptor 161-like isoform X1 [Lepeophtheirus salmonis]